MAEFDYQKYKEIRTTTCVLTIPAVIIAVMSVFIKYMAQGITLVLSYAAAYGTILLLIIAMLNTYRKQEGKLYKKLVKNCVLAIFVTVAMYILNIFNINMTDEAVQIGRIRQGSAPGMAAFAHAVIISLPMMEFIKVKNLSAPKEKMFNTTTPYMKKDEEETEELQDYDSYDE